MSGIVPAVGLSDHVVPDLIAAFTARSLTIGTAESLTGGLLAAVLTEAPGSSAVFRGGLVVYATDLKHRLAGVDAALLARCGPVDPHVAVELARGARLRCAADIGVGLTGVAGPDPQNGVPVGTWYCAVLGPADREQLRRGLPTASATRAEVRSAAVTAAVELLANIAATDS